MKINRVNNYSNKVNFKNALSTKQEKQLHNYLEQVKSAQGTNDGLRVVKLYGPALPQNEQADCGIGKINSQEAGKFYDLAKTYYYANAVKFMPYGQLTDKQVYSDNKYSGAYNRSTFAIGEDVIDISQLSDDKWGNILSKKDCEDLALQHRQANNNENLIDFNTTLGYVNQENYPVNLYLSCAFDKFKNNPNPNEQLKSLRVEFEQFKNQKEPVDYDDIYTRLALFPYIKNPYTARVDFFKGYDSNPSIRAQKQDEYNALKEKYKNEIEFYKFKQFLAHKTVLEATQMLHDRGLESISDCPYGFSWPEVQAFPDAFLENAEAAFGLPVLNYYDLTQKADSPAHRVLRDKIAHQLLHHDGTRLDVGWAYIRPGFKNENGNWIKLNAGNTITNFIEKTAYEIKGPDYNQKKIMYECDAAAHDFSLGENIHVLKNMKGLAVLQTEDEKNDDRNIGWGNLAFYEYNLGLSKDDLMLGTNNHDGNGVLHCASNKAQSNKQVGALMRVFNRMSWDGWKNFKDDNNFAQHILKYVRARFAEIACAKNNFILFTDLFGRKEMVDYHTDGTGQNGDIDYRNRLERNYEENLHKAMQNNEAYNIADVETFRMEMDGSKDRQKEAYEALKKFSAYLKQPGNIMTKEQADNSQYADLDIANLTYDEISNINV